MDGGDCCQESRVSGTNAMLVSRERLISVHRRWDGWASPNSRSGQMLVAVLLNRVRRQGGSPVGREPKRRVHADQEETRGKEPRGSGIESRVFAVSTSLLRPWPS
jgi:hypothetical protein